MNILIHTERLKEGFVEEPHVEIHCDLTAQTIDVLWYFLKLNVKASAHFSFCMVESAFADAVSRRKQEIQEEVRRIYNKKHPSLKLVKG